MNKSQFVQLVAEKAQMTKSAAARVVDAIFDATSGALTEAVRKTGRLSIPGFGKFVRRTRKARVARNPRTGQLVHVPARETVAFTPGRTLRAALEGKATPKSRRVVGGGGSSRKGGGARGPGSASRKSGTTRSSRGGGRGRGRR